ncbi:hypothetical protein RIF29_15613 [Crotalaria pallida]|uniref:Vacuolar protein sorting-associated protein n=1 Tax=Crotalaria pallida TaxID=3830 RepID=A0AAN9FF48_CROPI
MFEGLVHQLLLGYLGRYFKDIQKQQLKIRLEEVLLENVELILEAFDYLQLPFALKQGRVGRLSIKIPWKKPWDPIVIILDDVFVSASQRGDQEWGAEAVEKREFAGKKAKLAAAELGKLSRRVSGSHAGQSFISHVTAKILDSIQVDIRNFHILYSDVQTDLGHIMFGLKFSNLTMKQNPIGSSNGRDRVGQDHKIVEIKGLEFYFSMFHGSMDLVTMNSVDNSYSAGNIRSDGKRYNSILAPCDVTLIISANRSQKLDDNTPQYSVKAELSGLVISIDEAQLRQIFLVWDYVCSCRLREKYGRFRPWHCPLPRKLKGWQICWWHYAQESVLSDVCKKLKKTSWRYLGDRLSYRRKYINLYKMKLDFLQQEQPVDDDVLQELEQMEKESDLEDILNYRSAAEYEMREFLMRSTSNNGRIHTDIPTDKSFNDEQAAKSQGWLNWLSRGMLGAGGTDDSSQFSGVVSYDVKDISEATEFHPVDVATKNESCIFALKFEIHQLSASLCSKKYGERIAEIILEGGIVESKLYEDHGIIVSNFKSGKVLDPKSREVILRVRGPTVENNILDIGGHPCSIEINFSSKVDMGVSVKGMLQQLEVTFDVNILFNLLEFCDAFTSFKFHNERVLLSLNGIKNDNTRLLSKAEYIFADNKKVIWDITIFDVAINLPWRNTTSEYCNLVMSSRSLCLKSTISLDSFSSEVEEERSYFVKNFLKSISSYGICLGIQLQDLYHYFDVKLNDFMITIINSDQSQKVSILENFNASFFLAFCVIPDESILKQLEVYVLIESLKAHFSPSMYGAFLELITHLDTLLLRDEYDVLNCASPSDMVSVVPTSSTFGISIISKLGSVDLEVDLENSRDNSSKLMVSLQEMDIRYGSTAFEDFYLSVKSLTISAYNVKDEKDSHFVLLSGNLSFPDTAVGEDSVEPSFEFDQYSDAAMLPDSCFAIRYESPRTDFVCNKFIIHLHNADIHCYPHVVGLLVGFFNRLSAFSTGFEKSSTGNTAEVSKVLSSFGLQKFGFSNYFEFGSSDSSCIPLDRFPFVSICNSGSLGDLESSLIYAISDWRNYFTLRDSKIKSSKINMRRGSKFFQGSPSKSKSDFGYYVESGIANISNIFSIELHLYGIRAHFHDSSCIIGTMLVPTSKSSMVLCEDNMDILFSCEGLVLTSSWWSRNFQDYLWGPSSANLSPILNVRVRKGQNISSTTKLEVSISVQHVYCMLPSEYLSIIIGYFSLSDWGGYSNDQVTVEEHSDINVKNEMNIMYKFEILDSTLILPVESNEHQFIKVDMRQLYCGFIENCGFDDLLKNIPPESSIPIHKLAKRNNCLNVFGRDLFVSFLLYNNDMLGLATIERNSEFVESALIAPINADVWVRIPYETSNCESCASICFMTNISSCHIIAEDGYFFYGCNAILNIFEEFSSVDDQSKCFKSDVMQFLHSKRSLKANGTISSTVLASSVILTEVKCWTHSLLISFNHRKGDSVESIIKGDVQFICSASLLNDSLVWLDLGFTTLVFYSSNDSVLAKCTSTSSSASVLGISFSKSRDSENELNLCLSSLDIWLHLSEWGEVAKFFNHFCEHLQKTVPMDSVSRSLSFNAAESVKTAVGDASTFLDSGTSSADSMSHEMENVFLLITRSENICIAFHIPVWVSEEPCVEFQHSDGLNVTPLSVSADIVEENNTKFPTVSFSLNGFELLISGDTQLKSNIEKLSSVIMTVENGRHTSWPLFDMIQMHVEAVLCKNRTSAVEHKVEIICDHSDVWLSHPAFYLWSAVKIDIPKAEYSQHSSSDIDFKFQMRKVSILLTDGKWSYNMSQLEILVRNILFHANASGKHFECSVTGDLQVNYNNIEKVSWEPFVEPWQFLFTLVTEQEMGVLLNRSVSTDMVLKSTTQLNINITESLVECVSRATEMFLDIRGLIASKDHEGNKLLNSPCPEYLCARRCAAPYVLQNLTSVPLLYHVYHGNVNPDELYVSSEKLYVQPGSAIPIYMDEYAEEQLSRYRPSRSYNSLNAQRSNGFAHHYITVQLEGTSMPSNPMSMDLVGLTCFEVNFSKTYNEKDEDGRTDKAPTFVVPVVFDVSVLRYSKLIRIYSTVVLLNATSTPLELRFDIPFGLSPTILDPIHPGQQLPLPLHLAEAGYVRWRPMGNSYLWSEARNLSNLLSVNSKVGAVKSFVCYPSHPSSHPFRCCLSVKNISLSSSGRLNSNFFADDAKKRHIHHLILSSPLIINNYLPKEILLISESGGVSHTVRVSEVETSIYHIDPSHDLGLEICIEGFKRSDFKFPRLETFCTMAKFNDTKFSLSETLIFEPNNSNGPMYVTVEKVMDAYSGSREIILFVPFILYNCMGFPLCITETTRETNERGFVIPSYHGVGENETFSSGKDGLSLLSSNHDLRAEVPQNPSSYLKNYTISSREGRPNSPGFLRNSMSAGNYHRNLGRQQSKSDSIFRSSSLGRLKRTMSSRIESNLGSDNHEHEKVRPCMFSPSPNSSVNDVVVKLSRYSPEDVKEHLQHSLWSSPFSLLPPSGSSTILVPQLSSNSAFILAATSNSVAEQYAGRTNAISLQPRYVISNACSKEISYKQKGTDVTFYLGIGEHAHLHWTDTTRELLVSICYNESGWQWSGSFLPDHLGDTQLKMRNFVSGTLNMVRVEVQNADISMQDEKIVGRIKGNSGTNLILLSDDDTGYMPYRVDNFTKERLRIYQQKCEMFDSVIHSYASYPYTWDEPCYPHRLIVEVPGERVLGSYALDDAKEYMPVYLPPTSEKPERTFFMNVHAEGATKVLSVVDSNYHIFNDVKKSSVSHAAEKKLYDHKQVRPSEYKEKISISIAHVGISLINSYPQELLFACIKDIQIDLLQSLDRQSLSLQISFLQIDNQLHSTPHPVMLSFDGGYRSCQVDNVKSRDDVAKTRIVKSNQMNSCSSSSPVFCLEISKWRKKDISFISFEYIKLRMADFRLEIEQEVILSLFEFFTNVCLGLQYGIMPSSDYFDGVPLANSSPFVQSSENPILTADHCPPRIAPTRKSKKIASLPFIVPIGAPWQEIYLMARTQKKIYIEMLELAPIKLTLSFSSAPWMLRKRTLTSKEFLIHRGLMALADVEGAQIHLKDLTIAHHMASWESIQEILIRHYNRQLLHETYKLFGSAGVIGNPLGFARSMGHGIRDFLSVPTKSIMQSPTGLIMGMAQGTTSLLSNTVYAISDATSQFSKAARKGIVAFTYDDQAVSRMEKHQATVSSDSKGVINAVLEGLTGLLQSPIRGAERHGLPGVLSGVALGITGLVAKPAASILEVTGKTALGIRNRSKPNQLRSQLFRIRLPRPLSRELPLRPYSWEEAVGSSVLMETDDGLKFKDDKLVACKALKEAGKFVVVTERFVLIVFSPSLVKLGKPEFCGIPSDLEWIIEWEIGLESIIHADAGQGVLHIVGTRPDSLLRQNHPSPKRNSGGKTRAVQWNHYPTHLPLPQTNLELAFEEDATNLLQILLSAIENGKGKGWDCGRILHRANFVSIPGNFE